MFFYPGVGVAMTVMCAMVGIYYNVIMCYTLFYMVQSFRSEVPWKDCFSWWGADQNCHVRKSNQVCFFAVLCGIYCTQDVTPKTTVLHFG